jgi:hypothetical protein
MLSESDLSAELDALGWLIVSGTVGTNSDNRWTVKCWIRNTDDGTGILTQRTEIERVE